MNEIACRVIKLIETYTQWVFSGSHPGEQIQYRTERTRIFKQLMETMNAVAGWERLDSEKKIKLDEGLLLLPELVSELETFLYPILLQVASWQ